MEHMSTSREFEIGVLAGDGIGPEVSAATCDVLSEAAKLLDQIAEPEAELLSEQVSECAHGVDLLMTVDR